MERTGKPSTKLFAPWQPIKVYTPKLRSKQHERKKKGTKLAGIVSPNQESSDKTNKELCTRMFRFA